MDEERLQSYLNVINQLLTCENGQEPDILRRNQALIDTGLVQAMERVAGVLTQRGDSEQAEWLRQLANQLELGLASPSQLEKTEDRLVYRQVRSFEERFGKPHLYLAYHAAFPLALTPDLLYKIWANFQRDIEDKLLNIPWEAVADVLLSGLCKEVGGEELYEMDLAVRNVLLNELKANPRFGEERLKNLSEFVLEYIQEQIHSDDSNIRDFAQVQKWTALAYTKPDKAAQELALALREKLQQQNKAELVRMASVVETLAEPLVGFEPLLVYSRGMGKLARGDNEQAFVQFRELGELGDWVRVKGVSLPVPSESLVNESSLIGNLAWSLERLAISEQRKKSYFSLIQLLLNCSRGEEAEILKANSNLVDTGLLEMMKQVAAALVEQGEQNAADFLRSLANQLADALGMSRQLIESIQVKTKVFPVNKADEEIAFLAEVLQSIAESNGNSQVVYSLLNRNLDKLNDNFLHVLRNNGMAALSQLESEQAGNLAAIISDFSNLIQEFPLGNKANNLEIAITGYEVAFTCFTREAFPEEWAKLQGLVGVAYLNRIYRNRSFNIEKAIAAFQAALQICTREGFPEQWANIQTNLGIAYSERIRGEKTDNLEIAIVYFRNGLEVFTRESFPEYWARLQNNLGNAYLNRIKGDKAENLEQAIRCYLAAFEVRKREEFPEQWATIQTNLGNSYLNRIRGERAENLEQAIECYYQGLMVLTRHAFPKQWATIQTNLGNAYRNRIYGEIAENLERAIECYHQGLMVLTLHNFPQQWATIQTNLGNAYLNRIGGERSSNIEQAITAFQAALQVYIREAFPQEWAMTLNNLGYAYRERGQIGEAMACLRSALEIYTPTTFPLDCLKTGRNLGNIAFNAGLWHDAIEGYSLAIKAIEISRTWASSESRRQEILIESINLYENIVQACINNRQLHKAIEYVERSRSKRLVDLIASNELYASGEIEPEVQKYLQEYESLQKQMDAYRFRNEFNEYIQLSGVETGSGERAAIGSYNEAIASLETQKQKIWEKIRQLDPVLAGEIQIDAIEFSAIQQLIDRRATVILSFYSTRNDTYIFIIYQNKPPQLHTCKGQGLESLQKWIFDSWFKPYVENKNDWRELMATFLSELSQRLEISNLIVQYLDEVEELILVPHLYLHQIPFAALPIISNQYLLDNFIIRYVPSCQILQFCQQRPNIEIKTFGTVIEEGFEVGKFAEEKIVELYNIPDNLRLRGHQVTVINYRQLAKEVQCLQCDIHAVSRLDNPLESALLLVDGTITLGEILTPTWQLPNLYEVFLAGCETNLGLATITDDILTLSTGFLCAGARIVINTLWSVDDLSTSLLSVFYHEYCKEGYNRPEALRQAQLKLRGLTGETLASNYEPDLDKYLEQQLAKAQKARKEAKAKRDKEAKDTEAYQKWDKELNKYNNIVQGINRLRREVLRSLCQTTFPFANPYHWAAFTCQGLR